MLMTFAKTMVNVDLMIAQTPTKETLKFSVTPVIVKFQTMV